jgi:hypothetical protein
VTSLVAYMAGLFSVLALVGLTAYRNQARREPLLRTGAAIAACWLAGLIYVSNTDDYTPWHFNIFIDALAALAVMFRPAGRTQGGIGLLYFAQIAWHTAFGIQIFSGNSPDPSFYYDAITWLAWAQLAVLGAWCGGIEYGSLVHSLRNSRHAPSSRPRDSTAKEKRQ